MMHNAERSGYLPDKKEKSRKRPTDVSSGHLPDNPKSLAVAPVVEEKYALEYTKDGKVVVKKSK